MATQQEKDLWKNRRKMAWGAFLSATTYAFAVLAFFSLAPKETIEAATQLGTVALASLGFFGGVVTAYIGAATYSDVKNGES